METIPNSQNTVLTYFLILLSFFIVLFFTRNIFSDLQVSLDTREQSQNELTQEEAKLSKLNEIKTLLSQTWSAELQKIQGFLGTFSDADMMNYIYSYAQKINLGSDRMIIRDVNFTEGWVSDVWFDVANVSVSAIFSSEETLFAFLTYITSENEAYRFYITDFDYAMNDVSGNIQITLPLTLYYKK